MACVCVCLVCAGRVQLQQIWPKCDASLEEQHYWKQRRGQHHRWWWVQLLVETWVLRDNEKKIVSFIIKQFKQKKYRNLCFFKGEFQFFLVAISVWRIFSLILWGGFCRILSTSPLLQHGTTITSYQIYFRPITVRVPFSLIAGTSSNKGKEKTASCGLIHQGLIEGSQFSSTDRVWVDDGGCCLCVSKSSWHTPWIGQVLVFLLLCGNESFLCCVCVYCAEVFLTFTSNCYVGCCCCCGDGRAGPCPVRFTVSVLFSSFVEIFLMNSVTLSGAACLWESIGMFWKYSSAYG